MHFEMLGGFCFVITPENRDLFYFSSGVNSDVV